jgi:HPt (histidine-containing phosphotransfer) domain-containing protein
MEVDRDRCAEAGMNDTIAKPVRVSMLAKALERWVAVAGRSSRHSVSTLPPASALDLEMLRRLVSLDGEDDDFIRDVMGSYLKQLEESLDAMRDALREDDLESVRLTAHSLKGASKQLGAMRMGDLLGAIERAIDTDAAAAILEQMEQEAPRVHQAVQSLMRRSRRAS